MFDVSPILTHTKHFGLMPGRLSSEDIGQKMGKGIEMGKLQQVTTLIGGLYTMGINFKSCVFKPNNMRCGLGWAILRNMRNKAIRNEK